jgi:hypothetical protein
VPAPHYRFTTVADGDLAWGSGGVEARRAAVIDLPWTWLRQEHGAGVVLAERPGDEAGAVADAAVTAVPGAAVAVVVADCAPVVLLAPGAVGVVHAGWRGVVAGVLPAAVERLRPLAEGPIRAVVGPCIGPECYMFGAEDLARVTAVVGAGAEGVTEAGTPALHLRAAVEASLHLSGVDDVRHEGGCTACGGSWWSHRARADRRRQAAVAWLG